MEAIWWGFLVSGRVLPGLLLIPAFGGRRLPIPAQLGLCASVAIMVFPDTGFTGCAPVGVSFVGLLLKELCVGLVLALAGSCLFEALRIGGQLVDDVRGASQSRMTLPQTGEQASPLAVLHLLLACLVFFQLDGPALFLGALQDSFAELPVDRFPDARTVEQAGALALSLTAAAIRTGVTIAWPAAASVLCADVLLGFVNRTAPQIQVFFLGMPLRATLGIAVVALTLDRSFGIFASTLGC